MNRPVAIVLLVGLLAGLLALKLFVARGELPGPSPTSGATSRTAPGKKTGSTHPESTTAETRVTESTREVATPPDGKRTGDLHVRVTWRIGGAPAAAMPLFVRSKDRSRRWCALTSAAGTVGFTGLAPGNYRITTGRGSDGSSTVADLTAGETKEVVLSLPAAVTVTGVVIDPEGQPVADASLVVNVGLAGRLRILGKSDKSGRFALPGLATECSVGARADGFAPSLFQSVQGVDGGREEIRIELGGRSGDLLCRLVDSANTPIPAGLVRVGEPMGNYQPKKAADGSWAFDRPWREYTDELGEAHFRGFPIGTVRIEAWSRGFGGWRGRVEVPPGETKVLVIQLLAPVTLGGTVRDAQGRALPGLNVWLRDDRLGAGGSKTDAAGRYRIEGLPAGEIRPRAASEGLASQTTLNGVPGQTLTWNPVIETGRDLGGRVVGPGGAPFLCVVEAMSPGRRGWYPTAFTDKQGRFTLKNVAMDRPLRIKVRKQMFPMVEFERLPPAQGELLIELTADNLPSVRLLGKVVDPAGKPVAGAGISILRRNYGNSTQVKTSGDGSFKLGPYPPAEYRIFVAVKGLAKLRMPWRPLTANESLDYGEIRLEPAGTLLMHVTSNIEIPERTQFSLVTADGAYFDRFPIKDGKGRIGGLGSGSYRVQIRGKGIASELVPFTILPGQETRLAVTLRVGVAIKIQVLTGAAKRPRRVRLQIRATGGGAVVATTASLLKSGVLYGNWGLAPGRYEVRVDADGSSGEATIVITGDATSANVKIELR